MKGEDNKSELKEKKKKKKEPKAELVGVWSGVVSNALHQCAWWYYIYLLYVKLIWGAIVDVNQWSCPPSGNFLLASAGVYTYERRAILLVSLDSGATAGGRQPDGRPGGDKPKK